MLTFSSHHLLEFPAYSAGADGILVFAGWIIGEGLFTLEQAKKPHGFVNPALNTQTHIQGCEVQFRVQRSVRRLHWEIVKRGASGGFDFPIGGVEVQIVGSEEPGVIEKAAAVILVVGKCEFYRRS